VPHERGRQPAAFLRPVRCHRSPASSLALGAAIASSISVGWVALVFLSLFCPKRVFGPSLRFTQIRTMAVIFTGPTWHGRYKQFAMVSRRNKSSTKS
jgi:hypothetical protein